VTLTEHLDWMVSFDVRPATSGPESPGGISFQTHQACHTQIMTVSNTHNLAVEFG